MATIKNESDVILQATSPRLLTNPLNYISIIPTTNTITSVSGTLTPSTVTVKAILNGALRGTISWSTSPSVTTTPITDGIIINSTDISDGISVVVTATLIYAGNTYTATTNITRKQAISLSSSGTLSGEGGGSITSLDYSKVSGTKPPSTATSNFFSTNTVDPTGGNDGDAWYNSTTGVMWFKMSGVWNKGGTVNASQITVGTLAAARIAAGSIDATKLSVSTLSAITANLGSVTAGNITGTSNISITGTGLFNGVTSSGLGSTAISANPSQTATNGIIGYGNTGSGGVGVAAIGGGLASALSVQGIMTMTSTFLVSNLNADMVDGLHASKFVRTDVNSVVTGNIDITGTLQTDSLRLDQTPFTGTRTATFVSTNKPGSGTTSNSWISINCNGSTYFIPIWA